MQSFITNIDQLSCLVIVEERKVMFAAGRLIKMEALFHQRLSHYARTLLASLSLYFVCSTVVLMQKTYRLCILYFTCCYSYYSTIDLFVNTGIKSAYAGSLYVNSYRITYVMIPASVAWWWMKELLVYFWVHSESTAFLIPFPLLFIFKLKVSKT